MRRGAADDREHHVEAAGHDVLQPLHQSLVGNMLHVEAVQRVEPGHRQVVHAAGADRAVVDPAGILPGVVDQLAHRARREVGPRDEHQVGRDYPRHGSEILRRVVGQPGIEILVQREHGIGGEQVVVAIRRRLGDVLRGDDLVRARLVLDDDLLAPGLGELLAHAAHQQVGRAARGVGHDDANGFGGIGLSFHAHGEQQQE